MKVSTSFLLGNPTAASCQPTTINNKSAQQNKKPALFMRWMFALLMFASVGANAQVTVTGCTGAGNGSYATLTAATAAIVAAQPAAVIDIAISGNTTEPVGGATLVAGTWTSLTIQPTGGSWTISGAITAGNSLLILSGSDNVTINGLNTGGNALTLSNTTASATTGTSTIRFNADATNNTITNCSILGSCTMAVGTNGGNIFFSTGTTAGNDNNTISNNNIGPAGANLPSKGIYGNGSTTSAAIGNSGIIITNNNIFDFFGAAVTSAGIHVADGCNTWQITNNRFYQTGTRTWTTGAAHYPIWIAGTNATSGSNGYTITGNIIGYASNTQTGTYTLTGAGTLSKFWGIYFNGTLAAASPVTTISNNTVAAVSMTGVVSSGTTSSNPFAGIFFQEGVGITNGNTIGSLTGTGSLTFSTTTTSSVEVSGIHNFSSNTWTANNNNIGSISITNLSSGSVTLMGLRANTGTSVAFTATGNIIGGTTANSIQLSATSTSSQVTGINSINAPAVWTSNTVRNLTTNIGTGTITSASVIGLNVTSSTPNHTMSQNTIFNLSNTATTGANVVTGIQFTGSTANSVTRNNIYGLSLSTTSSTAEINGIRVAGGTTTYANNMIALGTGVINANIISGINEPSGTDNFYHNSVYIGGSPTAGTGNSFAFNSTVTTNTRSFRDNIFVNARSNGAATGKNYAVQVGGTAPNPAGLTINYNVYNAPGTGGVFGRFNALDVANLAAWKTAVGQDANSSAGDPQYQDPTNATPDLHINPAIATPVEAAGILIATVTDDFDGQTRSGLTPTDIGADAGNFTPLPNCTSTPAASTINGAAAVCTGTGTTLTLSTVYTDLGITYQWRSATVSGGPYSTTLGTAASQATGNLTSTTYYIAEITCTFSGLTYTTAEKVVTVNPLPTVGVSPSSASYCTPGGSAVTLTANGASTYNWSPTAGLTPTTGAVVAASPATTTTYTVTGTDANGCVNTATALITVTATPQSLVASATPSNICSGSTSTLNVTASIPFTAKQYTFNYTPGGANLDPMTGATTIVSALTDDAPMNTSLGVNTTAGNSIPIGFTVNFEGASYTHFAASPDGWIKLGTTTASAPAQFTNGIASSTNVPKITPYWDDQATGTDGSVKYLVTGSAPNRIFKVQWFTNIPRNTSGAANSTYQAWIYEGTGLIEFHYGTMGVATSTTISAGITGLTSTNFHSITFTSNTSSNSTANDVNGTTIPASGTLYSYTSPAAFTYAWAPSGDVVSPTSQSTLTNALSATETFTVTVTNSGCSATATTTVTVSPLTATNITLNGAQCANTNFTATANTTGGSPAYHYAWSDGVGGVYPDAQIVTINKPASSFTLSVTVTDACSGNVQMTLPITINALPSVTITPTPGDARICGTGSVSMLAAGASAYVWTPTTFLTPSNGLAATEVSAATSTTTYTVSGTDGNGCVGTASQTVTVGPAVSFSSVTATPSTICAGQTSALNAVAITTPSSNYTVAAITPTAETPSGSPTVLITGGTATPTPGGFPSALNDDGYWDGITLPFTFNYFGTAYSTVRIAINGNVQFGAVQSTGRNPGNSSYQTQTVPTGGAIGASNYLDNFIGGPLIDQDPGSTPFGTIRYFTNGVSPNQKFVISYESVHVFNSADNNTSQIILNENGTVDVLLLGGGLTSTASKVIGMENAGGTLGVAAPGRNTGTWTTAADEGWRFTPPALNYAWTPATGLTPSGTVSNPTTPALTSTTTYTVTATDATSGCNATGNVTVTIGTSNITATAGTGGSISPNGLTTINCGLNQAYTITADPCYTIADVVVDGVSQGPISSYTFTAVTAGAHTIAASFNLITYTITVSAGTGGSITPGTGSVNCGDNATYTISADACHTIADVLVDGVSQGAVGTYTFTNVTAAHTISASFNVIPYTITVTAGANGSITPSTGTVNCGDNATYTITPNACYAIADVVVDGVSQGAVGTYTFTNVTANHTISASFSLNTYTITVTAGANGSITPATGSVNCGDNATYTITPNACYQIADVVVDGVSQGAVGTYTFTNVTANHTISATFIETNYTITVTAGANGSITPATGTVSCGSNATYTITPNACYSIADVVVDGVSQGAVGTYTFTNVTANHTISATFALSTYTITVTAGANGSITPATGSVNCGDNATYTITPNACYSIADVVVDGVSQGAVGTYTFTNVTANHTISASFSLNTYTITVTAGANGSITPSTGSVNCGDNATYTITPNACYAIADVVVDGVSQGAVGTYTFTNVTANHTISATFVLSTYTITVTAGANGSITPATGSVNCGDNATYTITANACYSIADVVVDGVSQGAVGTYTFTNVTANHTISASFSLNTYTITVTAGANGSITPATGSVNCGDNATYTITANACYSIADVVVDGVSQGAVGTYTFTNVTANHTISASFSLNTYTITVTAGANGSITPSTGSVNCGDNATYTITANACYAIADVVVDGVSQGAVGTYTFTNVIANHTISATFVLSTYTITVTAGANGSITPATGSVNCGDNATYTITPNACYAIAGVVVDGVSQGAVGTYTFTNVTANHTISATFVLTTYTITVTAGANGSITPATGSVNCGANATYTITPNGGYAIDDVLVDGISQGAVGTYTFTNVTANHTISASFIVSGGGTFTINSSAGANGSITPNGATIVNSGANQSYTMSPAACYHVQDVLVDGGSVGAVTSYTFTNVTANHTISVTFAINAPLTVSVSGPVNVCPYVGTPTQVTYTATSAGATGFTWVIPPTNVTIISGQGTANLTVTFQNGFTGQGNKLIKVTALSSCGNSPQLTYQLVAQIPGTPQPIVASSSNVCAVIGTPGTITYTIPATQGAASYNWSAQAGTTTINHPNGPGINDTTVTVSFTNGFTSSSITVSASSPCGTGGTRSLQITRANPSTPGLISGPTNACPYMAPGGVPATYSVVNTVGNTYTWTVPAGAIGLTGQGTNTISFTYPSGFVSGTVTVFASNGCGTSGTRSLSISKLNPATPSIIDVIQTQPCPNREYTYTLSGMPLNATSVQWTVPVGATLVSGQGTISITVSYPPTAFNSSVTAQAFNNCGSSSIRTVAVHIPVCPLERTPIAKGGSTVTTPVESMQVNVYPNPTVNDFKLQVTTAGKEAINVRIMDMQGRQLKTLVVTAYQTTTIGSDLKAGTYMVEVRQGNNVKVTKLIKF